jgi:hypothetical protein
MAWPAYTCPAQVGVDQQDPIPEIRIDEGRTHDRGRRRRHARGGRERARYRNPPAMLLGAGVHPAASAAV